MNEIVTPEWLSNNLDNPNLIILDASVKTGPSGSKFKTYECTIPNSRRFDIENVFLDKESSFPNTIPKPLKFETECRKLGINKDSEIVVFDNNGIFSSPRVWWLFNTMGHKKISVLDGGFPNWIECGLRTVEKHIETFEAGNFKANFDKDLVVTFEQVKENITLQNFIILDARSEGRFNGTKNEPREYLQSGNIKNSINIPCEEVLNNGKFKSKTELNKIFKEKCNSEKELVFSCGSGITSCVIMLASQIGYRNSKKVFDGSWTEWAERNNLKTNV